MSLKEAGASNNIIHFIKQKMLNEIIASCDVEGLN